MNNSFKIQYAYDLGGQLKSLTEPYGEIVSYGHDKTGRLKSVSGNRTVENTQLNYVTDAKYRAWGAVKKIEYGNNARVKRSFEQQYTGMNVSFNAGALSVNVQAPSPHLSTWDLRRETSSEQSFQRKPKIDSRIPSGLENAVKDIGNRPDCEAALALMFQSLGKRDKVFTNQNGQTTIDDLFDRLRSIKIDNSITSTGEARGSGKRRDILIIESNAVNPVQKMNHYVRTAIQELLHHSRDQGTYSDPALDNAAIDALGLTPAVVDFLKKDERFRVGGSYQLGSIGHHSIVNRFCQYSQEEINQGAASINLNN